MITKEQATEALNKTRNPTLPVAYGTLRQYIEETADLRRQLAEAQARLAELEGQEPVEYQFQCEDGTWHRFIDERHYINTVEDGSWQIRALYANPAHSTAEALRALAEERDDLRRQVESYRFALAETEALELQHGAVVARLQTTIRNLEARDIHSCGPDCLRSGCVNRRLREQLVAAQAVIAQKDEAMRAVASLTDGLEWRTCDAALAIQSDDTALREMLAEQREKAAQLQETISFNRHGYDKHCDAEAIRAMPLVIDK